MHENQGVCGGSHCQSEDFATMNQKGVLCADGHKLVSFDATADIQHENRQTFAFRIEMGMGGDVQFPVLGGFVGRVTLLQRFGRGALAQRHDLVFVGAGGKLERLNQCGRERRGIHRRFRH